MLSKINRQAKLDGATAAFLAASGRAPRPANPHPTGSKRHLFWQWGAERAERLLADIAGEPA